MTFTRPGQTIRGSRSATSHAGARAFGKLPAKGWPSKERLPLSETYKDRQWKTLDKDLKRLSRV
ncbi:hypothetical protein, partial [Rhodovulum sulfidophilum]|uniref:hypothetical protein n=1 Tax=Rhodovulum sulfidophilum TaxID=35806 RepID=UPI001F30B23E